MKLKKINAAVSLLTIAAIFIHVGYVAFSYLTFGIDPKLKIITSRPLMTLACLHAILAMCIVFFSSDGTKLDKYAKLNVETVLQRATAMLILPFLVLHINAFDLLKSCAESGKWFGFVLLMIFQPVFYATLFTHVGVSFSRALVTLGRLSSLESKKKVDLVIRIICAVFFAVVSFAVIKEQLALFLFSGGAA